MAEDPDKIAREIEQRRKQLGEHVQELETKLHKVTDWRTYIRDRPLTALGAAFGVGLFVAVMMPRRHA